MPNSSEVALNKAKAESLQKTRYEAGLCLKHVRTWLGVPAKYPSAIEAWIGAGGASGDATHVQLYPPPPGVPVFWSGGRFGHIALSAGGGKVWTTDMPTGRTSLQPISEIKERWGYKYLGWAEVLNGVRIFRDLN